MGKMVSRLQESVYKNEKNSYDEKVIACQ